MGKKATLVNIGGEGSPRWKIVEEQGNHEDNPTIARAERWVTLPGDDRPGPINIGDEDLSHMSNWLAIGAAMAAAFCRLLRYESSCFAALSSRWQASA